MKIALISDIHFGANYGKEEFQNYQKEYFETFWGELDFRKIDTIFFLGDFFHHRRMVNFDTVQLAVDCWFKPAMNRGTKIYMSLGNHDVFYKSTNKLNSLDLLCWNQNIKVISEPKTIEVGGRLFCFLPWINQENRDACIRELENTRASAVMAHLELRLENLHVQNQVEPDRFQRFSNVFSGHYHTPILKDITGCKLQYLGSPYEMTWNDFGIKNRGFYIYDTETGLYELVKNEKRIHHYHRLGEEVSWIEPWHSIRCIVPNGISDIDYEVATTALKKMQMMRVQMVQEEKEDDKEEEAIIDTKDNDVLKVLLKYADNNMGNFNPQKMHNIIHTIWNEVIKDDSIQRA